MAQHIDFQQLLDEQLANPRVKEAYEAAQRRYEMGKTVRELREARGWTQTQLAKAARTRQSTVADLELGGPVPSIAVLDRLAHVLGADLEVRLTPRTTNSTTRSQGDAASQPLAASGR